MRSFLFICLLFSSYGPTIFAKTVVFWQDGFPTVASAPLAKQTLDAALRDMAPVFADVNALQNRTTLDQVDLLVMPYGSAFPKEAWTNILGYVRRGGNLLVLGGQPFRVPVLDRNGTFSAEPEQDAYSREIGIVHTYPVPQKDQQRFAWKEGYDFLPQISLDAEKYFVLEGQVDGLGYMRNGAGAKTAAPVVVSDRRGARFVMLDFQPKKGYWESQDGSSLLRAAAGYAAQGPTLFFVEMQYSALKPGETPEVIVHLRNAEKQRHGEMQRGQIKLELLSGNNVVATKQVPCSDTTTNVSVDLANTLTPGFYVVRGTYENDGKPREFYQNGFWVEDAKVLNSGPVLGVSGDFLTENGKPFFPFGTNYFTMENSGWLFSSARNADIWDKDFAEMERNGVTFVRTGVWNDQLKAVDDVTGGVSERFLRNLEAYLLCARKHQIAVNFTLFAFDPQTTLRHPATTPLMSLPGGNPYIDPVTIRAEQNYMLSILNRFKDVPYLSWDLINEPSFSNPRRLWKGNTPNDDPAELAAWHKWLQARYGTVEKLAAAWSTTPDQLGSFDAVPLPNEEQLSFRLEATVRQVNAFDYNLFAQDMFSKWVRTMVDAFHAAGSRQLIDVGQDEGGVENRVLNQFYSSAGVSFTTNHTYRANDALLWDSMAAKTPGVPNIVGETGYQPVPRPDGHWRYDEVTALGLLERKWAYGFANGTSGALSWDWAREIYFGLKRSDGSDKTWIHMTGEMAEFVKKASPYATGLIKPEVAIVLPQSLQLSVYNHVAIEAEQNCVRALYGYARSEAYMVGEDQIELLGDPKLIILPSPWLLEQHAWELIKAKVESGAVLLVSGRFDQDPHFLTTNRQDSVGIDYTSGALMMREDHIRWPTGEAWLNYPGNKTGLLERAFLPGNKTFVENNVGRGKILFVPLPLELNTNLKAVGELYSYALHVAGVRASYSTAIQNDPGMIICPTHFPHVTLYVLTSETTEPNVTFRDEKSGKQYTGMLEPGRAALLLLSENGDLMASYNWSTITP
jgi:Beta-galactosidase